jgi:phospholipid transport system substrate-binding protein
LEDLRRQRAGRVWLADNYRNSFAQEVSASGIDGLIAKLTERNKAATSK